MNRADYYNYIEEKVNTLAYRISTGGKLNMLSLHLHSESFYQHFFNLLYNYNLVNLNQESQNVEAIDLIDRDEEIIIQVSSSSTKAKIEGALKKDSLANYSDYTFKFISIANDASDLRKTLEKNSYKNPHSINFNLNKDIHDISSMLSEIYSLDIDKLKEVFEFIEKELGKKSSKLNLNLTSHNLKTTLIGREKELKEIDQLINNSDSLLLINGIGGVGKSAIASYYLHTQKENYTHYGFFEGLESFTTELIATFKLEKDATLLDVLAHLRELDGKKILVLDDVKNVEENQESIEKILALKDSDYKILLTSREEIEDVKEYHLDVLSIKDAKELFNSIYPVDDEKLLEEILGYLDCHALFVAMTAKTLKNKKSLTVKEIKTKFENGEFSTISVKRKESFENYLNKLFNFDKLDQEEVLILKQLSALPSIEIDFEFLEETFQKKEDENFEDILNYLVEKGWLIGTVNSYKLHQIIKEYIWSAHLPLFKEIEVLISSYNELLKKSEKIQTALEHRKNIVYFEALQAMIEKIKEESEEVALFINNCGNIYGFLGAYKKSEPRYLKALKIREELLGENHLDTATSYNNLAGLYESMGVYEKSEAFYLKALRIREELLGENHSDTATFYNDLAGLYQSMGVYEKSERLSLKALHIREELLGEKHSDTATSYNTLGLFYHLTEAYKKAEPLFLKAFKIREELLGENHPDTATSYNNLAELYHSMGAYEKAETLYLKALKISEELLGENHPDTVTSYNNLAGLYRSMEAYEKAEPLYLKALRIREELLGENHPDTATSYNNLAVFYYGKEDFQKAYDSMERAVDILESVLPENHPNFINSKRDLKIMKNKLKILFVSDNFIRDEEYREIVSEIKMSVLDSR